jgi:hypothetical protein
MGLSYRKRISLGKLFSLNISKSGVSVTARKGPLSLNTRGGGSVKIAKGLSYRFGKRR